MYSTIKNGFLYYIGTTQSKFDVLKKQILIAIVCKFENIDPEELLNRLQAKKVNNKYMTDLNVDELYGKALSAVKIHWELKYVTSEEEQRAFSQQWKFKQSMLTSYSQHKIGHIEFSPAKQEYESVKEDQMYEISQKCFSGNETHKDHEILQDE